MTLHSTTLIRRITLAWETLVKTLCHRAFLYTCHSLVLTALQTRQLTSDSVGQEDLITAIDSSDFPSFSHAMMSIEIPPDLVGMFSNMSGMGSNGVRLGSFLYANVTGLFSSSLPGEIE